MSRLGDYRDEMRTRRLLDREIEKLLTGAPVEDRSLALLTPLVEGFRSSAGRRPQESDVRVFAARAAAVVLERSHHRADAAASRRRRATLGLTPRLAAVILAVLMVPAMAGAALAADSAIPGDALYGLDRAFEMVGIGAGSTGERLAEAAELAEGGRSQEAIDHALLALEADGDTTNALALEALGTLAGQIAGLERAEVVALLAYVSENAGAGVGADGMEFGQGVADLARAIGGGTQDQPNDAQGNGPTQPGATPSSPGGPPADYPGQGQENDNAQDQGLNGETNGNSGGQGQGSAPGSGSGGNPNGNGDPGPPDDPGNAPAEQPPQGPPSTAAHPVAPESGGDDADEANQDDGLDPNSPSVTAPGGEKKP